MRSVLASWCSHRNTVIALVIVTLWACLTTSRYFGVQLKFVDNLWDQLRIVENVPTAQENLTRILYHAYINQTHTNTLCNNTDLPHEDDPVWLSLRWREKPARWVLYNRVPKTGSSAAKRVIKILSKQNNFNVFSSGVNVFFNVSVTSQEAFVQEFYHMKSPLVYDRHINFVDFTRYGEQQPMYINTIRHPISHFLSFYYFMRKMSAWKQRFTHEQQEMSLDACLNASLLHCETHRQYRFYCGQDPICKTLHSGKEALALAKRHIEQHYAIVGISEDLHGFFSAIEVLAPQYFRGAATVYVKHKNDMKHFTTKKVQPPLTPHTENLLRDLLKYDFDLYHFAKQRFHKQKCIADSLRYNDFSNKNKLKQ